MASFLTDRPYGNPPKKAPPKLPAGQAGKGKMGTGSQWGLSNDDVEAFLFRRKVLPVSSSNVAATQFIAGQNKMIVQYLDDGKPGQHYRYDGVTEQEALSFANAGSKGVWTWTVLRVRGSKTAHRKPFSLVGGFEPEL